MTDLSKNMDTLGLPAWVPDFGDKVALHNQRLGLVQLVSEAVDRKFIYYLLSSSGYRAEVLASSTGTTVHHTSPKRILRYEFPLPPMAEQRGIAAMLGALDDKIESNRRVVALLECRLALEFKRAKAVAPATRTPLGEMVETTKGVSYKSVDLKPSRTSLVTLKSFDRRGGYKREGLKPYVGDYKPQQVISPGEIVVAQTDLTQGAEVIGRAVLVPADHSADTLVASLDLVIVRPREVTEQYLLGLLTDEDFREHCRSRTSGTTVLHLAKDAIPTYQAPIAPSELQDEYSQLARPLLDLVGCRNQESVRLAALRDALLPKLLSGRIRVPEPEEGVAGVVA